MFKKSCRLVVPYFELFSPINYTAEAKPILMKKFYRNNLFLLHFVYGLIFIPGYMIILIGDQEPLNV